MAAAAANKFRVWIFTGAFAAITATGAWYGAGLKTQQEYKQERTEILQATPAERIEQMELAKAKLMTQRTELQTKIERLTAKVKAREAEEARQET